MALDFFATESLTGHLPRTTLAPRCGCSAGVVLCGVRVRCQESHGDSFKGFLSVSESPPALATRPARHLHLRAGRVTGVWLGPVE